MINYKTIFILVYCYDQVTDEALIVEFVKSSLDLKLSIT